MLTRGHTSAFARYSRRQEFFLLGNKIAAMRSNADWRIVMVENQKASRLEKHSSQRRGAYMTEASTGKMLRRQEVIASLVLKHRPDLGQTLR